MIFIFYLISSVLIFELLIFIFSLIIKRQDIADVFWGPTFIYIAIMLNFLFPTPSLIKIITLLVVTIWGSRLSLHIWSRNRGKTEDKRYVELSKKWGKYYYLRSFFQTFLLQGILALFVSMPVTIIYSQEPNTNIPILFFGIFVWMFGFIFETISDNQLSNFLKNRKDKKIMDQGLWKYSRHPNYFGEILLWWGIFIISLSHSNYWYLAIIGPLTITILILKVSGIPMLEKRYAGEKEYEAYKKKTSKLIPLPPK